jgi:hypothetical protein
LHFPNPSTGFNLPIFSTSWDLWLCSSAKLFKEPLRIYSEEVRLWTSFDVTICLKDFGSNPKLWTQVWQNVEAVFF